LSYIDTYLDETTQIVKRLDRGAIGQIIKLLVDTRTRQGRLFLLGVGGSAANASHAVNDFRKIAGIEAYTPTDNVSELSARVNDEGWDTVFAAWLEGCHLINNDLVFVLSVGGGNHKMGISVNLVHALQYAKQAGAKVCGIVGRDGGYTAEVADACVVVPTVNLQSVTAHAETFQAVIWHLMVTHPEVQVTSMKWESTADVSNDV